MRSKSTVALLASLIFFSLAARADQPQFPKDLLKQKKSVGSVVSPLVEVKPVIDGKLDDECWKKAGKAGKFFRVKISEPAKERTTFFFTHDKKTLYVGAIVADSEILAAKTVRDKNIWEDDCIEIFFDPDRNRADKFQFITSSKGVLFDAMDGKKSWNPTPDITLKTHHYPGKGWSAEFAIPFKSLGLKTPGKGEVWDLKLAREDYLTTGGAPKLSSWRFCSANLHDPGAFGKLIFVERNRSVNGDFNLGLDKPWSSGSMWRSSPASRKGTKLEISQDEGHASKPCGKVTVASYTQIQHLVPVGKNRNYRVSCWVNIDKLGKERRLSFYTEKHTKVFPKRKKKGWQQLVTYETSRGNYLALTYTTSNSTGSFLIDDVEVVELDNLPLSPDSICYTGNATGEQAKYNKQVKGKYTYYELGTNYSFLPQNHARGTADIIENVGWIPFNKGKLTDGKATFSKFMHWTKNPGKTILMDLGANKYIEAIEIDPVMHKLLTPQVYLKQDGGDKFVLVGEKRGKFGITQFQNINAHVRYVRIDSSGESGYRELRVWGKKRSGNIAPKAWSAPVVKIAGAGTGKGFVQNSVFSLFPTPKEIKLTGGILKVPSKATISIPAKPSAELSFIANDLAIQLRKATGSEVVVVENTPDALIQLSLLRKSGKDEKGKEGFTLNIADKARITGGGLNGLFYGCQTLLQCVKGNGFRKLSVRDWPSYPFRALQVWGKQLNHKKIYRTIQMFARLRINYLFVMGYGYQTKKFLKELAKLRMESIPICCAMPSGNWCSRGGIELNPGETEKDLPSRERINPCPSLPDIDARIDKEINKIKDIPGKYAYINCDEMYQSHKGARWNVCKLCRARKMTGGDLFADLLNKIHKRLASIGKTPIMLDTMLHVPYKGMDKAFEKIPKDIPIMIWHPRVQKKCIKLGFPMLDFYDGDSWSIDHKNKKVIGGMVPGDGGLKFEKGLLLAEVLWSGGTPSLNERKTVQLLCQAMKKIHEAQIDQPLPSSIATEGDFQTLDLSAAANASLADLKAGDGIGFFDQGKGMDLSFMKGKFSSNGVPFVIGGEKGKDIVVMGNHAALDPRFPSTVEIPVNKTVASLLFLHTMTIPMPWTYSMQITYAGTYIIEYADKTKTTFPILYKTNILESATMSNSSVGYKSKLVVIPQAIPAYDGMTKSGQSILLMQAEWVNPCPKKKIASVRMQSPSRALGTRIALFALTAVTKKNKIGTPDKEIPRYSRPLPLANTKVLNGLKEINIFGGKFDSMTDYTAPNGVKIHISHNYYLKGDTYIHQMKAGFVTFDSNFGWQTLCNKIPKQMTITLPKKVKVKYLKFAGLPETPEYIFGTSNPYGYTVEVSENGKKWEKLASAKYYLPDRDLERVVAIPSKRCNIIRITLRRTIPNSCRVFGISRVQLYK